MTFLNTQLMKKHDITIIFYDIINSQKNKKI